MAEKAWGSHGTTRGEGNVRMCIRPISAWGGRA